LNHCRVVVLALPPEYRTLTDGSLFYEHSVLRSPAVLPGQSIRSYNVNIWLRQSPISEKTDKAGTFVDRDIHLAVNQLDGRVYRENLDNTAVRAVRS